MPKGRTARRAPLNVGEGPRLDASGDTDFMPDHALADGDVVSGDGWALEAVTTPGHTANHMAFALRGTEMMFSGDHVMAWSTPVVAPPDGAMSDYMASLRQARAAHRDDLPAGPWRPGARRAAVRPALHSSPQGARGFDPAPARQGRGGHPDASCARFISGSIRGLPRRPDCRCWRISKTWSRAARS